MSGEAGKEKENAREAGRKSDSFGFLTGSGGIQESFLSADMEESMLQFVLNAARQQISEEEVELQNQDSRQPPQPPTDPGPEPER